MTEYARVSVNIPQVSGVFDYHLPVELEGRVRKGCLVEVPFGKQMVQGIVLERITEPEVQETKPVSTLLDPEPVVSPIQLTLARWMADHFLAPFSTCLDLMLPAGLVQLSDTLFSIINPLDEKTPPPIQQRIFNLIKQKGDLRGRQLDAAFPRINWRPAAQVLVKNGILSSKSILPPPAVRPKIVRTAQLVRPLKEAEAIAMQFSREGPARDRRIAALRFLNSEAMPVNVSWVYAASQTSLSDLEKLAENGLIQLSETEIWRDPLRDFQFQSQVPPQLTPDQEHALETIEKGLQTCIQGDIPKPCLLHGVTGSGKTEIYLRAVELALALGKQAIIMVPEIALTPQTVRRFLERFPGKIGLVHSQLSMGERYDTWRRARAGLLPVIIGPRSALFMPLPDIGLIILDECHDGSYYQEEISPAYHAVDTALEYARQTNSVIVLGSATPSVEMLFQAEKEGWERLELPLRMLAHRKAVAMQLERFSLPSKEISAHGLTATLPLPRVKVVDMREELKEGNRSAISRELQEALSGVLAKEQQAILYLNRRGTTTYVFCRECGQALRCPRCDQNLTYHSDHAALICHTCNYRRQMPQKCPQCGSDQIRQYGLGTEGVEKIINEMFPQARTLRWDWETTRQKGAHEIILSHFANHRADILIGTQMLAKGLDLPLVTLVGVILADVGLSLPDYRAGERVFQLLSQVAGRAGRSPLGGEVIFQTYQPEHYAIRAAAMHDYAGFSRQELAYRQELGYPPYSRLVRLEFRDLNSQKAESAARSFAGQVRGWIEEGKFRATEIIGPVPCFYSRKAGYYRWQVVLKGPDPARILVGKPLEDARVSVDPLVLL